ncbi:MAG: type I glyceraldehyde-3-phosphate dehydrogenase [Flavobacteriales bacterium]
MKAIGINGFGRIGRCFTRIALERTDLSIALVNDLTDAETLAHLLKYDSVHGVLPYAFELHGNELVFSNGKRIVFTQHKDPKDIPWAAHQVETVIESTGLFLTKEKAGLHLHSGAKKVIISAPGGDSDIRTVVLGVNNNTLESSDIIISNASCTTNNVAPLISVILGLTDIEVGHISTVHSYTSDQRLHDAPHKDLRRARAAVNSIIPTSTGAAKAIIQIFPHLKGKLTGSSVRVPVIDGSMTELTLVTASKLSVEQVNEAMRKASETNLNGILGYTTDPIVSCDIIGSRYSCLFDAELTMASNNLVRLVGWYDNEMGYSARLVDLVSSI